MTRLGNYTSTTRIVALTAGQSYTFTLAAKSWSGTTLFNVDPVTGGYAGALATDADALKTLMTIITFSK